MGRGRPIGMLHSRVPFQIKRHTKTKCRNQKSYSMQMEANKSWAAVLISDKIDLKIRAVGNKRRTFHNDKRIIQTRGYNSQTFMYLI